MGLRVWLPVAVVCVAAAVNLGGIALDVLNTRDLAQTGQRIAAEPLSSTHISPPKVLIRAPGAVCLCTGGPGEVVLFDPAEPCRCRVADQVGCLSGAEGRSVLVWLLLPLLVGGVAYARR